ncbi:MAG: 7 transmembrane receptor, partial [Planctomycetota bacterium]
MWVNDGVRDCATSGSDEQSAEIACRRSVEFACADGLRCLPASYVCDGTRDCVDGSDEWWPRPCVSPLLFRCPVNGRSDLISWRSTLDSVPDCDDGSDLRTHRLAGFKCLIGDEAPLAYHLVPQYVVRQRGASVCADHSDACYDADGEFTCERCLDGVTAIGRHQICDGIVDCHDLSDECTCQSSAARPLCERYLSDEEDGSSWRVCDGRVDREDGMDERFCESAAHVHRAKYRCITWGLNSSVTGEVGRCDGVIECPYADDECSRACDKPPDSPLCSPASLEARLRPYGVADAMLRECGDGRSVSDLIGIMCDGRADCPSGFDELHCGETRFACRAKHLSLRSIERAHVCDLHVDCFNSSDELNCSETTHFYCHNRLPLFVARHQVRDGFDDCSDGSDEQVPASRTGAGRSFGVIRFRVSALKFLVWVPGAVSLTGNLYAIAVTCRSLKRAGSKQGTPYCNSLLILNLAVSDLLMGVSLLLIAVESRRNAELDAGRLGAREREDTVMCEVVGVITVVSSQTSMFLLSLITALRLRLTVRPFESNRINHRLLLLLVALAWLAAVALAAVPLVFVDRFTDVYLIAGNRYFRRRNATRDEIARFIAVTNLIRVRANLTPVLDPADWSFVDSSAARAFPRRRLDVMASSSYYSSNGVCFPNLYSGAAPHVYLSASTLV